MSWNIIYFQSFREEKFVKKFVDKQGPIVKAKFIGLIDLVENYGPFLSSKYTKKIKNNLYELRLTGKEQIRFFYTVWRKNIILLNCFKKKTQKTPIREIKTALKRLELLDLR